MSYNKFDIKNIHDKSNILIVGRRGTGKTIFIKDFIKKKHYQSDEIFCVCPTIRTNSGQYDNLINKSDIQADIPDKFIDIIDGLSFNKNKFLVIFDDCVDRNKDDMFRILDYIYFNNNQKISVIVSVQTPLHLCNLNNIWDYRVFFRDDSTINVKKIFDTCKPTVDSFQEFENIFNSMTQNYSTLIFTKNNIIHHYKPEYISYNSFFNEIINENNINDIHSASEQVQLKYPNIDKQILLIDKQILLVDKQIELANKFVQLELMKKKHV